MRSIALIAALFAVAIMAPARAQTDCPDGKTFTGSCLKPELGETVRKQVFVFTQPKISYTAPPVLPSEDGIYAIPRDYHELQVIYGVGANAPATSTCVATRTNPC
jgi:hypothetical protein